MNQLGETYLSTCKRAPQKLGRVLVLGLGVSGKACAQYLLNLLGTRVESVVVASGTASEADLAWAEDAEKRGAQVFFDHQVIENQYDLCIASPGISEFSDFYLSAAAASSEIVSEVEFAWRESSAGSQWVAITGTNGKTTTTALIEHLLKTAGLKAAAVGNIGDTCIKAVAEGKTEVYVAEVSSYQLASTRAFAPQVAVVLNITPDHLSWHRSHENYAEAKWKVLANLAHVSNAVAVLDATNDEVRAKIREIKALSREQRGFDYVPVGTAVGLTGDMRQACGSDNASYVDEQGILCVAFAGNEYKLVPAADLQIKGSHNVANALAAASAALALGAPVEAVCEGLLTFAPIEHRIEPAGEINGVVCYNDSKATNVDAVLKALVAFEPKKPIILLGGRDKGTDLTELVVACQKSAQAVVCFGEARERFLEAFQSTTISGTANDLCGSGQIPILEAGGMEDALDQALVLAKEGDIVLLSPACASFDEFSCYEERGDVFKKLVKQRAQA